MILVFWLGFHKISVVVRGLRRTIIIRTWNYTSLWWSPKFNTRKCRKSIHNTKDTENSSNGLNPTAMCYMSRHENLEPISMPPMSPAGDPVHKKDLHQSILWTRAGKAQRSAMEARKSMSAGWRSCASRLSVLHWNQEVTIITKSRTVLKSTTAILSDMEGSSSSNNKHIWVHARKPAWWAHPGD